MKIKTTIKQSKEGQMLLEQKRMILSRELEKYRAEEQVLKQKGEGLLSEALHYLKMANVEIGLDDMLDISEVIEIDQSIDIKYKTIMGVEIPSIVPEETPINLHYGLYNTTNSVDMAILKFAEVKKYILELAQMQNTMIRLKKSMEKVQRRANALKEIIIPKDEKKAKEIQDILDETEKEEFIRLKKLKKKR